MPRFHSILICAVLSALASSAQPVLPGSARLTMEGDLAAQMVQGIDRYLMRATANSQTARGGDADARRGRFRRVIGAVDRRLPVTALQLDSTTNASALVASGHGYRVLAVRWPVFEGVDAEGLLLEPVSGHSVARVIAIPDAGWSPEMLAGIQPGVAPESQFARRLAENGCQVLVPVLIDRADTWSGFTIEGPKPVIRMTNQPHREWIYRMAFEVGRHIIGYEVQKVLAAVDWFVHENETHAAPILAIGYGEGGLLALDSAALDPRIQTVAVSGYFQPRQAVWTEPVYRDVWGLLTEFGDAELAGLIAPRPLIVEASRGPEVSGPPPATKERSGAVPNGRLETPPLPAVRQEVERARPAFAAAGGLQLVVSGAGDGPPGCDETLSRLLRSAGVERRLQPSGPPPVAARAIDTKERVHRQFNQLVGFTQRLVSLSPGRRAAFWSKAEASSPERWKETAKGYRDYVWSEVIGRLPGPSIAANPRTRLIYEREKFSAYEVVLDVWPDVFAYGILLVPKGIRGGERRPVVVCQHGLEGRPRDVADPDIDSPFYHKFAVRLAEQGFVTFSPQNPYIGEDRFRVLQRKAHPLKLSLFSFIVGQHQRILEWLSAQPFVDPGRIGFYGLSYGGKTAMRVPALLDGYALSICSGDFNEWVWKTTNLEAATSYMLTREYDMYEFDLANVANYAEFARLIAPRPFMVERGSRDGVGLDEWVAFEYAKVRRFYQDLGIAGQTEIEFFDGPHTIHAVGTFEFLNRHLRWPVKQ